MEILNTDEILKRYSNYVAKAEKLGTVNNKHYIERKSVIYWLNILNKQNIVALDKEMYNKKM